jgi:hypothetical protein
VTHLARLAALAAALPSVLATVAAQFGSLTLPAGTGNDPRSVIRIGGNHLVISNQLDGWQHFVNVANPAMPALTTSFNPPGGDQWYEAEYTPEFGGRLFTGHRGGGLHVLDVSNPAAPALLTSAVTAYHYRGLRYLADPVSTRRFLYYNETNWGLAVYEVLGGGTMLTKVWDNFANGTNDGNGLELVGRHLFQYGRPDVSMTTRLFRAFDVTVPAAPVQVHLGTTTSPNSGHAFTQLRRHPLFPRILAARWYDGLDVIDVATPASPVSTKILPAMPELICWGSCFVPNSPYAVAWGSLLVGTTRAYWLLFLLVPPAGPAQILWSGLAPLDVHDVTIDAGNRIYMAGRALPSLASGVLQVW